jgi:hypothetical protein
MITNFTPIQLEKTSSLPKNVMDLFLKMKNNSRTQVVKVIRTRHMENEKSKLFFAESANSCILVGIKFKLC